MWWPEEQQVNKKVADHQMSSNLNLTTYVKIAQKMSEDTKYNSIQPYVYAKLYQGITNINPTKMQHITCTCSFMFIVGHKPPPLLVWIKKHENMLFLSEQIHSIGHCFMNANMCQETGNTAQQKNAQCCLILASSLICFLLTNDHTGWSLFIM